MERACKACGRTDTMVGKRLSARFCNATCRKRWQRRNDKPKRFRMHNDLRTDVLERQIAYALFYGTTGESALKLLAERLKVPIRQEQIEKEFIKVKEESESFLSTKESGL